jgi:hypothetical protein
MATNTILTPSIIAREALMTLVNTMVMGNLVRHDQPAEGEYHNVGDTITVRKPATFVVGEASGMASQDIKEIGIPVTIDRWRGLQFGLTAKQAAMTLREYRERYIQPAASAFAQDIDSHLCGLFSYLPYYTVQHATTVEIGDFATIGAEMTVKKVPLENRSVVMDPLSAAKYKVLPAILDASQKGDAGVINTNQLGHVLGFDLYESQNVATSGTQVGSLTGCSTPAAVALGAESMAITDTDATPGLLCAGTLFTIHGDSQVYSITKNATQTGTGCTIYFSPPLQVAIAEVEAITVGAIVGDGKSECIAFHKNCFTLVTCALAKPVSIPSEVISEDGVSVRITYDWDATARADIVGMDCLYGARCLDPELGRRFRGQ